MGLKPAYLVAVTVGDVKVGNVVEAYMSLVQVLEWMRQVEERQIFGQLDPGQLANHVVVAAPGLICLEGLAVPSVVSGYCRPRD